MKERIILKNSPIVETWLIVDFQSAYAPSRGELKAFVSENYANAKSVEIITDRQEKIEVKGDVRVENIVVNTAAGIAFMASGDEHTVIVAKKNRIEIRALGKYPSWEAFIVKASAHYAKCAAFLKPSDLMRIAIKSINRIEIPLDVKRFSDVITTMPQEVDKDLASVCAEFVYRDTQYYPDFHSFATVVRAYQRQQMNKEGRSPLFFDIEVFKTPDGKKLTFDQEALSELHDLKNAIFFGSIAPRQLESYK